MYLYIYNYKHPNHPSLSPFPPSFGRLQPAVLHRFLNRRGRRSPVQQPPLGHATNAAAVRTAVPGASMANHGKTMGKPMGKPWENHGKTMGKW